MKKRVKEEKVIKSEKVKEVICDQCSAIICNEDTLKNQLIVFYSVHTYHNDWGNDSIDSSEFLDLCSQKCLLDNAGAYYAEANGSESYDIEREETNPKFLIDD